MGNSINKNGFKYLELIAVVYVASLLIADTIAVKVITIFGFAHPAGILCFPICYILNDVLTEVYGFKNAKRIIIYGFICLGLMVILYSISSTLKPASFWQHQEAYSTIFSFVPRISLGSLIAYLIGSLLNSYFMVVIKKMTNGKFLWTRTVGSTIIGEGVDSVIFNTVAFAGIYAVGDLTTIILTGWVLKTIYEILATPFTYLVIYKLKKIEIVS